MTDTQSKLDEAKAEFDRQWGVAGMPKDKQRLAQAAWDACLAALKAAQPAEDGCTCQGCGIRYRGDLLVPDDVWERIKPAGKAPGAGLLCPTCIMNRIIDCRIWTGALASTLDTEPAADEPVAAVWLPNYYTTSRGGKHEVHFHQGDGEPVAVCSSKTMAERIAAALDRPQPAPDLAKVRKALERSLEVGSHLMNARDYDEAKAALASLGKQG